MQFKSVVIFYCHHFRLWVSSAETLSTCHHTRLQGCAHPPINPKKSSNVSCPTFALLFFRMLTSLRVLWCGTTKSNECCRCSIGSRGSHPEGTHFSSMCVLCVSGCAVHRVQVFFYTQPPKMLFFFGLRGGCLSLGMHVHPKY